MNVTSNLYPPPPPRPPSPACSLHRPRCSYVDTELDPYSASKGFFYAHMGWMLVKQDKDKIGRVDISGTWLPSRARVPFLGDSRVTTRCHAFAAVRLFTAMTADSLTCNARDFHTSMPLTQT